MKRILIGAFVLISLAGNAQIRWIVDEDIAKKVALEENKFILMDFWATWCGPCKLMDREMWSSPEINKYASKFVPLKIDVDRNQSLAVSYGARSIPMVVIIDPLGNEIWKSVGYSSSAPYFEMLENLPVNSLPLEAINQERNESGDPDNWMSLALAYQKIATAQSYVKLQQGLLDLSDEYLRKVSKKSADKETVKQAELNQILNDAYRGKTKSALKQVAKLDGDNSELSNYIQAYCYKCMGEMAEMEKYKSKIKDESLRAQLQ